MKNRRILATIVIFCLMGIVLWLVFKNAVNKNGNLAGPIPAPTSVPTPNAPKTFQFDSSTDLEAELQKVNPEVLDSDFE